MFIIIKWFYGFICYTYDTCLNSTSPATKHCYNGREISLQRILDPFTLINIIVSQSISFQDEWFIIKEHKTNKQKNTQEKEKAGL